MTEEIRWLGPYKETERFADVTTVRDIIRLRSENEMLKEVLELIITHPVEETDQWKTAVEEIKALANSTLKRLGR